MEFVQSNINSAPEKKRRGRPKKNLLKETDMSAKIIDSTASFPRQIPVRSLSNSTETSLKKSSGDIDKRERRVGHSTKSVTGVIKKIAKWQRTYNGKFFLFFEKEETNGTVQKYVYNGLMSSTGDEEVGRVHQGISEVTRFDLEKLLSGNNIRCLNHSYVELPTEGDVEMLFSTSAEKIKCEYLSCDLLATEMCFDCKSKLCSSHTKVFKSLTYCFRHFPPTTPNPLDELMENIGNSSFIVSNGALNYENPTSSSGGLNAQDTEAAEQIADLSSIPQELLEPLPQFDRKPSVLQDDNVSTYVRINPLITIQHHSGLKNRFFMNLSKYEQAVRNISKSMKPLNQG